MRQMNTEADTCRQYIVPKLLALGWDGDSHSIANNELSRTVVLFLSVKRDCSEVSEAG